jgi:hypothetical protein
MSELLVRGQFSAALIEMSPSTEGAGEQSGMKRRLRDGSFWRFGFPPYSPPDEYVPERQ